MNHEHAHRLGEDSSIHNLLGDLGQRVFSTLRTIQVPSLSQQAKAAKLPHEAAWYDLPYHLERVRASIKVLDIGTDEKSIENIPGELTQLFEQKFEASPSLLCQDWKVRIVASPRDIRINASPLDEAWSGKQAIELLPIRAEREFPEHKTTSALCSVMARKAALKESYDEALLVTHLGEVKETAWGNLFWVDAEGTLCTPASGVLPGVTRQIISEHHPVVCKDGTTYEQLLEDAVEVFVTQSTSGITPVSRIEKREFETPGPITQTIQQLFLQTQLEFAKSVLAPQ